MLFRSDIVGDVCVSESCCEVDDVLLLVCVPDEGVVWDECLSLEVS